MKRWLAAPLALALAAPAADAQDAVDYARDVAPLLARYCHKCHGPDKQESAFRLDTASGLLAGGTNGPAIAPRKSAESLLIQALTGQSDLVEMPPEGEARPTDDEIALLRAWIDAGATVPPELLEEDALVKGRDHWSFQPIVRPPLPAVRDAAAVRSAIDYFLQARLEAEGLSPSPEADRATLIRRVSLDLTGLPPSPEEVDAFLADDRPDAYERVVDRLLASPHYGERWGRHWLDLARYADSNGFTIDGPRSIWKYRDWVIDALNRDLPFDQFTIEQIAGDLLPQATTDQIVATGFHRNTLINQEGGTDPEQFRVESVVDRVNTTGSVFLGLTIGCAQCHSHKYDPISHREYYQLFAFYNNADEPTVVAPSADQAAELEAIRSRVAELERRLAEHDAAQAPRQAEWEAAYVAQAETLWTRLKPREFTSAGGALMTLLADDSILVGGAVPATDTYTVVCDAPAGPITALRVEALTHTTVSNGGPGLREDGNFSLTNVLLTSAALGTDGTPGEARAIAFATAHADDSQADRPPANAIDADPKTAWSFNFVKGQPNGDHYGVFVAAENAGGDAPVRLVLTLDHQIDLRPGLGRFTVCVTGAPREAIALDEQVRAALRAPIDQRSQQQRELLAAEFRKTDAARAPLASEIATLQARQRQIVGQITTTMVMQERSAPRETFVHLRGDFLRPGARVYPDVPRVLPPLQGPGSRVESQGPEAEGRGSSVESQAPEGNAQGSTTDSGSGPLALDSRPPQPSRLDLARWLVDPRNPLTARVTVNRFWQQYFGRGLVETENDFGTQGTAPTHPELLDWLASELVRGGWSVKRLHRLIVTSAAYRRSSAARPDLDEKDPYNKLLARQSRLRLDAEVIRDSALAASGLLCRKVGGPGVFPPQPEGVYRFTQQDKQWKDSTGGDRFRRAMYTYFWRSSPYPFLVTFDAPGGNVTCTRRVRSNTPLQALTLANDRSLVEIAQGLACRVLQEAGRAGGVSPLIAPAAAESPLPPGEGQGEGAESTTPNSTTAARVQLAFRLCLARQPSQFELQRLVQFYETQTSGFASTPADAQAVAPPGRPAEVPLAEAAAAVALARVLLNVDEFVTRE